MALQMLFRVAGKATCVQYKWGPELIWIDLLEIPKKLVYRSLPSYPCIQVQHWDQIGSSSLFGRQLQMWDVSWHRAHQHLIHTVFISSLTEGRYQHLRQAQSTEAGKSEAPGVGNWFTGVPTDWCSYVFHMFLPFHAWMICREFWQVALYVAGFPCTPYSLLHAGSELLRDQNARQFFKVIRNIKSTEPAASQLQWFQTVSMCVSHIVSSFSGSADYHWPMVPTKICILENVLGFQRVLNVVVPILNRNLPGHLERI